jgi:ABC-type cobalt transport system substrate-binding protein
LHASENSNPEVAKNNREGELNFIFHPSSKKLESVLFPVPSGFGATNTTIFITITKTRP